MARVDDLWVECKKCSLRLGVLWRRGDRWELGTLGRNDRRAAGDESRECILDIGEMRTRADGTRYRATAVELNHRRCKHAPRRSFASLYDDADRAAATGKNVVV